MENPVTMKKLIIIAICFYVCATSAFASFKRLTPTQSTFGLGLAFTEMNRAIWANLEYGIDANAKASFTGAIRFFDELDVPPSPAASLDFMHIAPFGTTGFDSFVTIGGGGSYQNLASDLHIYGLGLGGYAGLLKRLKSESSPMEFAPFFGVGYNYNWEFLNDDLEIDEGHVNAAMGLELTVSPSLIISGTYAFSFTGAIDSFAIGVVFY